MLSAQPPTIASASTSGTAARGAARYSQFGLKRRISNRPVDSPDPAIGADVGAVEAGRLKVRPAVSVGKNGDIRLAGSSATAARSDCLARAGGATWGTTKGR